MITGDRPDVAGILRVLAETAPVGQRRALRARARTHSAAEQMQRTGRWRGPVRSSDSWRLRQRDELGRWV